MMARNAQDAPGRARRKRVDCPSQGEQKKRVRLQRNAQKLLDWLRLCPITNGQAVNLGGLRYGARLHELRKAGYKIRTDENKASGFTTYTLEP